MGNSLRDMLKDLHNIQHGLNRLVDDVRLRHNEHLQGGTWSPAADVYESDSAVVVKLELPEIQPNELKISFKQNRLMLRGERSFLKDRELEDYHRLERPYGAFNRVFLLPVIPDPSDVKIEYEDGLLTITIPL